MGRGSWTPLGGTYRGMYALTSPMVGSQVRGKASADPEYNDYRAVWAGVKAIQLALNHSIGARLVADGTFGTATDLAVREAQRTFKLTVDGLLGPKTAKALFRRVILDAEANYSIPSHNLAGVLDLESESFDPGAVGEVSNQDKGLAQFHVDGSATWWNSMWGNPEIVITNALAFDAAWAVDQAARRMAYYRARYAGKGAVLQQECSIAQHNAPGWADIWFAVGVAPNPDIAAYVRAAQSRAAAYGG